MPADFGHLNCAAYLAGVVGGMLGGMSFPAEVTAHTMDGGSHMSGKRTVFVIKFAPEVMDRAHMQKLLKS